MKHLSLFTPWISRIALALTTLVFTIIGIRYIVDSVSAAAATSAILSTPLAATTTRIGFGAFPLAIAIFASEKHAQNGSRPALRDREFLSVWRRGLAAFALSRRCCLPAGSPQVSV